MPIYEYQCTHCGEPVEKLQRLSDAPLTDCPACGQATLKRKMSPAGFRLAGGGWYETDFKSDNRRNLSGDGEAAKPAGQGGGKESAQPAAQESKNAEKPAAAKSGESQPAKKTASGGAGTE